MIFKSIREIKRDDKKRQNIQMDERHKEHIQRITRSTNKGAINMTIRAVMSQMQDGEDKVKVNDSESSHTSPGRSS